jgi:predicted dehydrogenase
MDRHKLISVFFLTGSESPKFANLLAYLQSIPHISLTADSHLTNKPQDFDVVITTDPVGTQDSHESLSRYVEAGGGWLMFVNLSERTLPPVFGVQPEPPGPQCELRVLFENFEHPLAARLPDAIYLQGRYHVLTKSTDDCETILYADWHYSHKAVLAGRRIGTGRVACTTLQDYGNPELQRIIYRLVWMLAKRDIEFADTGIGILGYAPSVGLLHGLGTENTAGLALRAVCDSSPQRLETARKDFPGVKTYASANQMVDDPDVNLVIIATPPNSHADLCLQMLAGAKHVICEKPLALNRRETDAMVEMADERRVHLSCHQNRRWDSDFLAIRQALEDGLIGDLFYLESFVGGFHHPCGYWHSDARVSGGTSYDWGAHYLDWMVALMPYEIEGVMGTRHKRVWHDVTNADQERIQIRFSGGQEAEFIHSDIAAARKPKWYLLGNEGAIVGEWRDVTSYEIDPVLYFRRHDVPATEMAPDLTIHRRHQDGNIIRIKPSVPERDQYPFHSNLADHLLWGEPLGAPLADSVKVVAILEAAARSMENGGKWEALHVGSN